ncbi:type II secretion system minor pseudopilin GspI [Serratia odorifera]|uniref:type II secretion system minor pseudopilin GspI n=1 Tax=Serratia odorifera TaxID=618 RepID=UPI0018E7A793|nr:type II secretion system minor pseudopilin GspI [Serratia odorifera]MBJ2066879.1 type II secretion system minor pseudopilin GspI [Serratia odorifera]HEJ9097001.1 type II secretion system minor pseudopilin GspI [Serratia odorifera]
MKARGMTLLEVMVALAILALAGLAVMKTSGEQIRNLDRLEQKQFAAWVADNQLTLLRLQQVWPAERWHHGVSVMAGLEWHWRWRGVATSAAALRAVEIEVRLDVEDAAPLALLRSYQARP